MSHPDLKGYIVTKQTLLVNPSINCEYLSGFVNWEIETVTKFLITILKTEIRILSLNSESLPLPDYLIHPFAPNSLNGKYLVTIPS
jgi:hypothetical protein